MNERLRELVRIISCQPLVEDILETQFIALAGGDTIIGRVGVRCEHEGAPLEHGAEVRQLWVKPEWRHLGIGRELMKACEEEAVRAGCEQLLIGVRGKDERLVAWYESHGYQSYEFWEEGEGCGCRKEIADAVGIVGMRKILVSDGKGEAE